MLSLFQISAMKVLWGIALCLCFSLLVNAEADPKKYNKDLHAGKPQKKLVVLQHEDEEPKEKKVPVPSLTTVPSEGKSAFNPVPENKGVIGVRLLPITIWTRNIR